VPGMEETSSSMCFSAEADFAVAAVVAPVGVATLRAAARPQELLLAALPLLLALHELTEGVVWLGLQGAHRAGSGTRRRASILPLPRWSCRSSFRWASC
jgi:hypothetical protein